MVKLTKLYSSVFFFFLMMQLAYGLGVGGQKMIVSLDFEPGAEYSYDYFIANNDGYTTDYTLFAETKKGNARLEDYFKITPSSYKTVYDGETRPFTVKLTFPDKIENSPGENEAVVWVRGVSTAEEVGISARPVVGIRFIIFVLYPWKTLDWSISVPPLNGNETKDITISLENQGEPIINSIYSDIDIFSIQNDAPVRRLKTDTVRNLAPKGKDTINATFDTTGLLPGEYRAYATLYWDSNISNKEVLFKIGEKNVRILNHTSLFKTSAINKFDIVVESDWNEPLKKVYADIKIFDKTKKTKLADFKTFEVDLYRLETKNLEAYFDTNGFDKGDYLAVIQLNYEGASTIKEATITISDKVDTETVDEIPGSFSLKKLIPEKITMVHVLIILLIIFILINIYLLINTLIKKKTKVEEIDDAVVEQISELKKKYNDAYIKDMMIKKGWSSEKVDLVFKKLEKKSK